MLTIEGVYMPILAVLSKLISIVSIPAIAASWSHKQLPLKSRGPFIKLYCIFNEILILEREI